MARKPFQTKISHARFVVGAFSSDQMATLATILKSSVRDRIAGGKNVYDQASKPLTAGYAKRKAAKGRTPIRDWYMSGNTLRSMQVLTANENRAVIGFNNPIAGRIAHFNNLRERAFGVSDQDRKALVAAVKVTARGIVTVTRAA